MQILDRFQCVCVCHNAFEKIDMDRNEYRDFNMERNRVFNDIKQFLMMTLTYFEVMEEEQNFVPSVIAANLRSLIKSLCLLHALHGYPANPATGITY